MTDQKEQDWSFATLSQRERVQKNAEVVAAIEKYQKTASQESLDKTVKSLTDKGHGAHVFDTKEEAVEFITTKLLTSGASISSGYSTTINEIGLSSWLKTQTSHHDFKTEYLEYQKNGDWANVGKVQRQGYTADFFFSGASAVSEQGDIVFGDLTGSRVAALTAGTQVFVVGTNKIVGSYDEAVERLYKIQLPIESERAHLAYGVEGSFVSNFGAIRAANPFAKGRIVVVFIKGQYGY
jgi:L-lactate utilization protein LutB